MKDKSNTKRIIEIWMKACFEKLMKQKASQVGSDKPASFPSTQAQCDRVAETSKFSPKTRQDT